MQQEKTRKSFILNEYFYQKPFTQKEYFRLKSFIHNE